MSNSNNIVLRCEDISKTFCDGNLRINVLNQLNLQISKGETVAIIGRSGSGKSTLLHLLGGLEQADYGAVYLNNKNIFTLPEKQRCLLRNQTLGFVYQFHHLLPEFDALENICMPLLIKGVSQKKSQEQAKDILEKIGLAKRLYHKVAELSGGERQRVAIARALVTRPSCVLADEPTGNLDKQTAEEVCALMLELNRAFQTSLVIVTHDENLAAKMDRVLYLEEGCLEEGCLKES
ncbi:MAG: lipoprotein-releasing ABC transporter ATP-binding protein LolD [Gammaproteobacteria bacterium]|nr:lipoprotein-releasing ABC transporter ATP-binding protein LolD [Gammaproteobacteria bacterium]